MSSSERILRISKFWRKNCCLVLFDNVAMIALLAIQSSIQTFIHDVILFVDTSNNAWSRSMANNDAIFEILANYDIPFAIDVFYRPVQSELTDDFDGNDDSTSSPVVPRIFSTFRGSTYEESEAASNSNFANFWQHKWFSELKQEISTVCDSSHPGVTVLYF